MTNEILAKLREWADKNASGWVLELLYDERPNPRGPLEGRRVCDTFAEKLARERGLIN